MNNTYARKPGLADSRRWSEDQPQRMGFAVRVNPRQELSPESEQRFFEQLTDYLNERQLSNEGSHLLAFIKSYDRNLNPKDQVDLLVRLIDNEFVAGIEIGPLQLQFPTLRELIKGPWIKAETADPGLGPVLHLYRIGQIRAQAFIHLLRRANEERNAASGSNEPAQAAGEGA